MSNTRIECDKCEKIFTQKHSFIEHYSNSSCKPLFSDEKNNLYTHLNNDHTYAADEMTRTFKCKSCDITFRKKYMANTLKCKLCDEIANNDSTKQKPHEIKTEEVVVENDLEDRIQIHDPNYEPNSEMSDVIDDYEARWQKYLKDSTFYEPSKPASKEIEPGEVVIENDVKNDHEDQNDHENQNDHEDHHLKNDLMIEQDLMNIIESENWLEKCKSSRIRINDDDPPISSSGRW